MITLLILWLIFGNKGNSNRAFDAEEDDFEEMLIMGMLDDDE